MHNEEDILKYASNINLGSIHNLELRALYKYCKDKDVLELGSETGTSSVVIASSARSLICVDIWDDSYSHIIDDGSSKTNQKKVYLEFLGKKLDNGSVLGRFRKNCAEFINNGKLKYIQGLTGDVHFKFEDESFDVIFLDADHSYLGCSNDIKNYLPKLKSDGFFIGHDYGGMWRGVTKAFDEYLSADKIKLVEIVNHLIITYKL